MKTCLNCQKEFENKREAAKYCSDKCRVMYNRKNPRNAITPVQVQVLYNEMLELVTKMKRDEPHFGYITPIPPEAAIAIHNAENKDQMTTVSTYDYKDLKQLILASTSSFEIEQAWKIVKAASWLAGWQLKELTKLRENQQTKIDF